MRSPLSQAEIQELRDECDRLVEGQPQTGRRLAGARGACEHSPVIRELVGTAFRLPLLTDWGAQLVRCIIFDKRPGSNWKVGWHRDLNIKDHQGDILPREQLDRVVTLRLHLDPTPSSNGALKVIPRSHLTLEDAGEAPEVTVEAKEGDVLVLTPLLLHASSESRSPAHRRIIHADFLTG